MTYTQEQIDKVDELAEFIAANVLADESIARNKVRDTIDEHLADYTKRMTHVAHSYIQRRLTWATKV